jgi:hypothetical protein
MGGIKSMRTALLLLFALFLGACQSSIPSRKLDPSLPISTRLSPKEVTKQARAAATSRGRDVTLYDISEISLKIQGEELIWDVFFWPNDKREYSPVDDHFSILIVDSSGEVTYRGAP